MIIKLGVYLSKLNKREKLVFYGAVLFVGASLIDRIVLGPILHKMALLNERIDVQEDLIRKNARIVAEKDRVQAVSAEFAPYLRAGSSQEEEVARILEEVEKLARKTSLYVVDMKPMGMTEEAANRKYTVDLNCEAQMEQIVNFMYELENSPTLLVVESFSIAPKSKETSIAKCNMRIAHVIFL